MDWASLLTDNFIPHVASGPLTTRGHIEVKCPFCGENDPSMHLGINLTTNQWNCWRDATHKGASPYRLISALLGISGPQARLVYQAYSRANIDDFDAPQALTKATQGKPKPIALLPEFDNIEHNTLSHKFWLYLYNRGFDEPDQVIEDYNLKCCLTGRWKGRLIIPVYGPVAQRIEQQPSKLKVAGSTPAGFTTIGWQGRSIRDVKEVPRYLTSSSVIKQTIFNLQNLAEGETLYICEGPFDALKIDFYGKPKVRATCTFGVNPTPEQIYLLSDLCGKFSHTVVLFDADSAGVTGGFYISDWISNISFGNLPDGMHDAGQMSQKEVNAFLHSKPYR